MFSKLILSSLCVGGLGIAILGTNACSYLTTGYNRAADSVTQSIPIEFQIDRARDMIDQLTPEIRRSMHIIAKEEVALEQLNSRIETAEKRAAKSKTDIMHLQADLNTGAKTFHYAGHSYSVSDVKRDLSRRFNRHKTADDTIKNLLAMQTARNNNLDAAQQKLQSLQNAQRALEVDVENLLAKHKLVEVAQATSDLNIDDSQLAKTKELIADIRARLDVTSRLANAATIHPAEIRLEDETSSDIIEQVASYFEIADSKTIKIAQVNTQLTE